MYNHLLYFWYWVVNAGVLLGLWYFAPESMTLGNAKFVTIEAAIYSGFWLTFVVWTLWDLLLSHEVKLEVESVAWGYFLLANLLGLALVAYAHTYTGLQISGWWLVIAALVVNQLQRLVWGWVIKRPPHK